MVLVDPFRFPVQFVGSFRDLSDRRITELHPFGNIRNSNFVVFVGVMTTLQLIWKLFWFFEKKTLQQGSEYSGDLKSDLFEGQISNCLVLVRLKLIVPSIWKPDHLKSWHFCPDFKWLGYRISHPLEIWTIWNPTSFLPLEIQTGPDFRSPPNQTFEIRAFY